MKHFSRTVLFSAALLLLPALFAGAQAPHSSFQELNGVLWFYTSSENLRFRDLEARLPELERGGIRVLGIYSPYQGDPEKWLGCDPLDYYSTHPASGSLDDFRSLVRAAHARGMKVVAYFTNFFLDRASPFFRAAEAQVAAGNLAAREASAFRWTKNPKDPLPLPDLSPHEPGEEDYDKRSQWLFSATAKAWYWSQWGEAALDFSQPGGMAEATRVMQFWLDAGLDGFMFDAAQRAPLLRGPMVDLPTRYTSGDKWITFESTSGEEAAANDAYGLTSWFNHEDNDHENDYSLVALGKISVGELEKRLQRADFARARGKTTHAWAKLDAEDGESGDGEETPYPDPARMRVQEAALLAGAGILFGAPFSSRWDAWPQETREAWSRVLRTVNETPALRPSASRARVQTATKKAYAMKRVSLDGAQAALLVYNFDKVTRAVELDLADAGIELAQQPRNLSGNEAVPAIAGAKYRVALPPYGFRWLEVRGR